MTQAETIPTTINNPESTEQPLISVRNLHVAFGEVEVLRGVDFDLSVGKTLALVGESGCGKTVTALSIPQLLPDLARITAGSIIFNGQDLTKLSRAEIRKVRGRKIGFVFQEPMTSLNPVIRLGEQIAESLLAHKLASPEQAWVKTIEIATACGIPDPENSLRSYPHEFSGGQRQRVGIAIALACRPSLLIADEPTTALDATIQAQILRLLKSLQQQLGMAMLFITHDLHVVAELADQVAVMYAGKIVESGSINAVFEQPLHPYTQGLFACLPSGESTRLEVIPGAVPDAAHLPSGCAFHPRCREGREVCGRECPEMQGVEHQVACFAAQGWK